MSKPYKDYSKYMSFVLRHHPEEIDVVLEDGGWAPLDILIKKMNEKGYKVNLDIVRDVVNSNDKKRFTINEDKTKIKANQGHSVEIDLKLQKKIPPVMLYHGTSEKYVKDIKKKGILKMKRHHVHLSADKDTAINVGFRHGKPFVLSIDTKSMYADNIDFYQSDNNVWLTDYIAPKYII